MDDGPSKRTRGSRQKVVDIATKKIVQFDTKQSNREKRKINQRLHTGNKKIVLYNEKGIYIHTSENLCDCLEKSCEGCHFPCPKCSSTKCGHECRNNRKWMYNSIENEGSDYIIKNPYIGTTTTNTV